MQIHFPVTKIVIHKAEQQDTIFLFTPIKHPNSQIDYIQLQFQAKPGTGEQWLQDQLGIGPNHYEVVAQDFEVCAP